MVDFLDGKIENSIPARNGAQLVAVCEAAFQAIQSGRPQRPAWFKGPFRILSHEHAKMGLLLTMGDRQTEKVHRRQRVGRTFQRIGACCGG